MVAAIAFTFCDNSKFYITEEIKMRTDAGGLLDDVRSGKVNKIEVYFIDQLGGDAIKMLETNKDFRSLIFYSNSFTNTLCSKIYSKNDKKAMQVLDDYYLRRVNYHKKTKSMGTSRQTSTRFYHRHWDTG